jgi:hypothetical protein
VLLTVTDAFYNSTERAMVTDEILIRATPDQVWPHLLSFPEIPDRPDYWIFRLGPPYPTQTTNGGNFVGADRQCMFSDGIVIKERVAKFVPGEKTSRSILSNSPLIRKPTGTLRCTGDSSCCVITETAPRG